MQEARAAHQGCRLKHGRQGGGDTADGGGGGWVGVGSNVGKRKGDVKKMEMKES